MVLEMFAEFWCFISYYWLIHIENEMWRYKQ